MIFRYSIQKIAKLVFILLLITSCSNQNDVPNFIYPEKIDAFSKKLIILLNKGDINKIKTFYNNNNLNTDEWTKTKMIIQEWGNRKIENISIMKINFYEYAEYTEYIAQYLVNFNEGSQIVHIEVVDDKKRLLINNLEVENFQVKSSNKSHENVFSITYKHIIFLSFTIAYVGIIVYSLVLCIRNRAAFSKKLVLFLFILVGIVKINFNWSTGAWGVELLSIGVALPVYKLHSAAPIYLSFYIPIGALLYLIHRKK